MGAKILIYDIETNYLITKTWGIYESNAIGQGKGVIEDTQILCFAYRWYGEDETHAVAQRDFEDYVPGVNNDYSVVATLWHLFNEADIVIAHNGNRFDQKKARARMIYHNFAPHSPFKQIDTKLVARKHFGFTSNKLDDLAKHFKIPGKLETGGIETWDGCIAGDKNAWDLMIQYNKQDVVILEQVYQRMLGWMDNHPNLSVIVGRPESCPSCLAEGTMISNGFKTTQTSRYRRFRCNACGAGCTERRAEKEQKVRYKP